MSSHSRKVMNEAEMRQVFERFDEDKDGSISREELQKYMSRLGFDMSGDETLEMINTVDHNKDGTVDFKEFYSLYQNFVGDNDKSAEEVREEEDDVLEAFKVFDTNNDGFISAQELQSVLKQLGMKEGNSLKSCQTMIENVNPDGKGRVDLKQFREMMSSKQLEP